MKKFIVTFVLIFTLLLTVSCTENNNKYKLTVIDEWGLLIEPLNNEYEAGEIVEVKLGFRSGPSVGIDINGKYIGENAETKWENGCPVISFIMPEKDSILYTTLNGLFTDPCEDSHDFNEGEIINVPGSDIELIVYRCIKCGHSISENINNEKYYDLIFSGETDYLINDISGKYLSGSTITIPTKLIPNTYTSLELYANGVKLNKVVKPTDGKAIYYHFTMPNENCIIEIKVINRPYLILDKPEYLHTPWIENSNGTYLFINNRAELVDYIDKVYQGMMFLPDYSPYKQTSGYNDDFFNENFLIVFQTEESSGGNKNKIKSYYIENRVITIDLEMVVAGESCDMKGLIYFLPLSKDLLETIDEAKILKNGIDITNR